MTIEATRIVEGAPLGHARSERITRFRPAYRRYIAALTSCSSRAEDLAESFPAMLFALATGYASPEARERCFMMIEDGSSLREAAEALGLPYWLRRLPAAAFQNPIPELPDSEDFLRRVGNAIPQAPIEAGHWLERIAYAYQACDEGYACWVGRQTRFPFRRLFPAPFTLLAAYAWFSAHRETPGGCLIKVPFDDQMGIRRAYDEARAWRRRIELAVALGNGITSTWVRPGEALGYSFVPLASLADFLAEADAMGNCLDQYAAPVRSGNVRVFSVRRDGRPVANLELTPHGDDGAMPQIEQLRGPSNARVPARVWQAAYAWLGSQAILPFKAEPAEGAEAVWSGIWQPYLQHLKAAQCLARVRELAGETKPGARQSIAAARRAIPEAS
ncbi:MAG: hypothetical protein GC150_02615 [Rhizobiales bacterium]|nr:hypothetical protein [Hyphomicrobiales bacterium]